LHRSRVGNRRRQHLKVLIFLAGALFAVATGRADAHQTSLAKGQVSIDGGTVRFVLTLSIEDVAAALDIGADLAAPVPRAVYAARAAELDQYLNQRIRIDRDGDFCLPEPVTIDYSALPDEIVATVHRLCPETGAVLSIEYLPFFDIHADHRLLGSYRHGDGAVSEFIFDRDLTLLSLDLDAAAPAMSWVQHFGRILRLGVEHILTGIDHILFLIALIVASVAFWPLARIVTAFTLGHSLTLALAWYGVIDLPARWVETVIALSIAVVAIENVLGRGRGHRWMLAGLFGLVHGLGFYGALRSLDLARGNALSTLLGFNLGVEIGQLFIVAVLFGPLLWWARRSWYQPSMRTLSALLAVVALWWAVQRALAI